MQSKDVKGPGRAGEHENRGKHKGWDKKD